MDGFDGEPFRQMLRETQQASLMATWMSALQMMICLVSSRLEDHLVLVLRGLSFLKVLTATTEHSVTWVMTT
jgi:hypothetical protein